MNKLQVTLIQTALHWEDTDANLRHFTGCLSDLKNKTNLIVLPEMFSTGFSMRPAQLAEPMEGKTMQWMRQQAALLNVVVTGSIIISERGHYYNRLIWMRPDGTHEHYDKRHLFGLGDEHKHYAAGEKRIIVTLHGWQVCPLVCYDLRFPVWCRNTTQAGSDSADYDLLLFVANWPERRNTAWKNLLRARAIENQAYVVGLNRIGNDGNGIYHSGDSALIDPLGDVIFTQADTAFIQTFSLDKERLQYAREKMPFLKDGDKFEIWN